MCLPPAVTHSRHLHGSERIRRFFLDLILLPLAIGVNESVAADDAPTSHVYPPPE